MKRTPRLLKGTGTSTRPQSRKNNGSHPRVEIPELTLHAFAIAIDSVTNVIDFIESSSRLAFLAVKDCERELDQIERQIDQRIASAITQVNEPTARELLACVKCITDLERIGDLLLWSAQRIQDQGDSLKTDKQYLLDMAITGKEMLVLVQKGFIERDADPAAQALQRDRRINRIYHSIFRHSFQTTDPERWQETMNVLLIAQALERAGDHVTNLAEELFHLLEGESLRHSPKRNTYD